MSELPFNLIYFMQHCNMVSYVNKQPQTPSLCRFYLWVYFFYTPKKWIKFMLVI